MAGQAPRIDTIETKINSQNTFLVKVETNSYTTSTTNILPVTNVPQGLYRVTVGARAVRGANDQSSYVKAILNGSDLSALNNYFVLVGHIGSNSIGDDSVRIYGLTWVGIAEFPNPTNSFHLDITISSSGAIERPFYILEKLDPYTQITTEWD